LLAPMHSQSDDELLAQLQIHKNNFSLQERRLRADEAGTIFGVCLITCCRCLSHHFFEYTCEYAYAVSGALSLDFQCASVM